MCVPLCAQFEPAGPVFTISCDMRSVLRMCCMIRVVWAFISAAQCCWQGQIGLGRSHLVSPWRIIFLASDTLFGPPGPMFTKMRHEVSNTTYASWSACYGLSFELLNALVSIESDSGGHISYRLMDCMYTPDDSKFGLPDHFFLIKLQLEVSYAHVYCLVLR